ncbi:hypothetical protein QFZ54_001280 [Sphingomonas faeni]|nr:hypothetical protein [Sphingomonas faeni]
MRAETLTITLVPVARPAPSTAAAFDGRRAAVTE